MQFKVHLLTSHVVVMSHLGFFHFIYFPIADVSVNVVKLISYMTVVRRME